MNDFPPHSGTLILMMGLPYSGKTTQAMALAAHLPAPVVCPDSIRLALHGHRFIPKAEPMVWTLAHIFVQTLFEYGYNYVILDACNVSRKRRKEWESTDWTSAIFIIDTTPETCRARAQAQGDKEIISVIDRMAGEWELPDGEEYIWDHVRNG